MTQKYQIRTLSESGRRGVSAGNFKTYENAKKALRKYYKIDASQNNTNGKIVAYQIVNLETGVIVEQSGRM